MSNSNNLNEHGGKDAQIYTKLKFIKSEETGAVVSFASKNPKTGQVCGVRQDSKYPKKVCVVDKLLANDILLNVLYSCTMVEMKEKNGYVVIEAEPVQFKAHISTSYIKNNQYVVEVKFGNKTIKFDPYNGQRESVRDLSACKKVLEKRVDVKDLLTVIDDFEAAANKILTLMSNDRFKGSKDIK